MYSYFATAVPPPSERKWATVSMTLLVTTSCLVIPTPANHCSDHISLVNKSNANGTHGHTTTKLPPDVTASCCEE